MKWGAYHRGTLCCTGTQREMRAKVDNERRDGPLPLGWDARPIVRPTAVKKRKRLPRFSRIGKLKHDVYTVQAREYRAEHPRCEFMRWADDGTPAPRETIEFTPLRPVRQCRRRTTSVHHTKKRGRYHNDKSTFFPACFDDHEWIESNKREAVRLGYLVRVYERH